MDRHGVVDRARAGVVHDLQEAGEALVRRHVDLARDLDAADGRRSDDDLAAVFLGLAAGEGREAAVVLHATGVGVVRAVVDIAASRDVPAEARRVEQIYAKAGRAGRPGAEVAGAETADVAEHG